MVGWTDAKAIENNFFVSQDRDPEDRNRLETDVVPDVNGAFQRIFIKGRPSLLQTLHLFWDVVLQSGLAMGEGVLEVGEVKLFCFYEPFFSRWVGGGR